MCLLMWNVAVVSGRDKASDVFFVQAECQKQELVEGDSCLVVYWLYSAYPLKRVEKADAPRVKGCKVSEVPVRRVQQRVRRGRRVYYAVAWQGYRVVPEKVGTYRIPECKYEVVLSRGIASQDPFERFWGRMERYEDVECSAEAPAWELTVKKNPPRTTEEILRSGGTVL